MKKEVMTAALLLTALGARAEIPQMLGTDWLSRQILTMTAQANAGVRAVVGIRSASGSVQAIELKLADAASAPFAAKMAPAASSPAFAPKPASGLAPKAPQAKSRKSRRAVDQLKRVSKIKTWR